jgi:SHS2 domain-containing protein
MKMIKFKFLPNTADIKFQAYGKTLDTCFKNAGYALKEIITGDKIKETKTHEFRVEGKDIEQLLLNFLEEFIILLDRENLILSKITELKIIGFGERLKRREYELVCKFSGDSIKKYNTLTNVKAITYNEMFVKKEKDVFTCQVVVDV